MFRRIIILLRSILLIMLTHSYPLERVRNSTRFRFWTNTPSSTIPVQNENYTIHHFSQSWVIQPDSKRKIKRLLITFFSLWAYRKYIC